MFFKKKKQLFWSNLTHASALEMVNKAQPPNLFKVTYFFLQKKRFDFVHSQTFAIFDGSSVNFSTIMQII